MHHLATFNDIIFWDTRYQNSITRVNQIKNVHRNILIMIFINVVTIWRKFKRPPEKTSISVDNYIHHNNYDATLHLQPCKLFRLVCMLLDKQYANYSMKKVLNIFTHNLTAVVSHHAHSLSLSLTHLLILLLFAKLFERLSYIMLIFIGLKINEERHTRNQASFSTYPYYIFSICLWKYSALFLFIF